MRKIRSISTCSVGWEEVDMSNVVCGVVGEEEDGSDREIVIEFSSL